MPSARPRPVWSQGGGCRQASQSEKLSSLELSSSLSTMKPREAAEPFGCLPDGGR